jgi:hypothetical protein
MNILVKPQQRCKHCDVDAYYTLSIEDFNLDDISVIELCPSVKAFKMEPASLSCP